MKMNQHTFFVNATKIVAKCISNGIPYELSINGRDFCNSLRVFEGENGHLGEYMGFSTISVYQEWDSCDEKFAEIYKKLEECIIKINNYSGVRNDTIN